MRAEAIDELYQEIRGLKDVQQLMPHLQEFLHFTVTLLGDTNATIRQTTIKALSYLVDKLGARLSMHVSVVAKAMVERLGDVKKGGFTDALQVLMKLMEATKPQKVLDALAPAFANKDSQVRGEALRLLSTALLKFHKSHFDFTSLVGSCVNAWHHRDETVKRLAVESLAVMHGVCGPVIFNLLDGVYSSGEVHSLLHERLTSSQALPKLGKEDAAQFSWEEGVPSPRQLQASINSHPISLNSEQHSDSDSKLSATLKLRRSNLRRRAAAYDTSSSEEETSEEESEEESESEEETEESASEEESPRMPGSHEIKPEPAMGRRADRPPPVLDVNTRPRHGPGVAPAAGGDLDDFDGPASTRSDVYPMLVHARNIVGGMNNGSSEEEGEGVGTGGDYTMKENGWGGRQHANLQPHPPANGAQKPDRPIFLTEPAVARPPRKIQEEDSRSSESSQQSGSDSSDASGVGLWLPSARNRSPEKDASSRQPYTPRERNGGGMSDTFNIQQPPERNPGRLTGRKVASSISLLKRRQESRRANSAHAVMQREYGLMGERSNGEAGAEGGGLVSRLNVRKAINERQSSLAAAGGFDSGSSRTFAPGGISTPRAFKSQLTGGIDGRGGGAEEHERAFGSRGPSPRYGQNLSSRFGENRGDRSPRGIENGKPPELTTEELQPCPKPDKTMKELKAELAKANASKRKELDWLAQYEAINKARRLVKNHPQVVLAQLSALIVLVAPAVAELRSYTARNAIQLFNEMFLTLKRAMNPELDKVVPVLLKKAGEASTAGRDTFLAQEADTALKAMITHCNEGKATMALINCRSHKSPHVRLKVIAHLEQMVSTHGARIASNSDLVDRLVTAGGQFLEEAHIDARAYCKRMLWQLRQACSIDDKRFMARIPEKKMRQVQGVLLSDSPPPLPVRMTGSRQSSRSLQRAPSAPSTALWGMTPHEPDRPALAERRPGGLRGARPVKKLNSARSFDKPGERGAALLGNGGLQMEEDIIAALDQTASRDWKARCEGLKAVEGLFARGQEVQNNQVVRVFDQLTKRLTDGNSKVVIQSLTTISSVLHMEDVKERSGMYLNTLVPALAQVLGSTNEKIRGMAHTTVDTLCREIDNTLLIQNMAHCTSQGGVRGKPAMLEKLNAVALDVYPRKPQLVTRHVLPAVLAIVNEKSSEIRAASSKVLCTLAYMMGPQFYDYTGKLPSHTQKRVRDMLGSNSLRAPF